MEDDDHDDVMWNILYASGGAAAEEGREPESTARGRESISRELPVNNNAIHMLKEQRETYKSEADALREEMELFRKQLAGFKNHLPQQKLRQEDGEWEESSDIWDEVENMEFAQPYSDQHSGDDLFVQHAENYFKKDWEFSNSGRGRNVVSRQRTEYREPSNDDEESRDDAEIKRHLYEIPRHYQGDAAAQDNERYTGYISADSSSDGSEQQRVSFSVPEVSHECEYDETCVTISVEPKHGTILPPRVQRWKNVLEAAESMESREGEDDDARQKQFQHAEASSSYKSDQPYHDADVQTDDYDYNKQNDSDIHYSAAHTQTENEPYPFYAQSQELEVIPEVDECELSNGNGEYTKDMRTVQKLLDKYGKSVSSSMDEQEILSVEPDMPLVQIENIDAVIEYRGTKDPDAWFERHANLSQEKEDRGARGKKKISLTMAISPKSEPDASFERRRRNLGEQRD
ncbi:MAG: hypothetical protein SGARI_003570 [Bacillariaceae sp.]